MDLRSYLTADNITLATGIAGGVIALAFIGLIVWNRQSLAKGMSSMWQHTFSQGGLFYAGMGLFMIASVVEAGPVLNKIAMHGALFGYGGHMLVFAFDMIAAVSLRARLNARRVFDTHGMKVQMWGIWLPALVSISANLAGALQNFNANDFNHLFIFAWVLPFIGAVFPSMIVVLSLAADHIIDTTAITKKIDVKEFEAQEQKRVEVLKVRLKTEGDLLEEEKKIAAIRRARDEAQGKATREWIFLRWLRPETVAPLVVIKAEIDQAIAHARAEMQQQAQTQAKAVAATMSEVQQALATVNKQLVTLAERQQQFAQQVSDQQTQFHHFKMKLNHQQQQFMILKGTLEGIASTVETVKVNHAATSSDASNINAARNETSTRAKGLKLQSGTNEASYEGQPEGTLLQGTGDMTLSKKERAFIFMAEYQRQHEGAEPSLEAIMEAIDCAIGSASNYRTEYRRTHGMRNEAKEEAATVDFSIVNGHS